MKSYDDIIRELGRIDRACITLIHDIALLAKDYEALDVVASRAETALSICAGWVAQDSINAAMQVTADAVADAAYKEAVAREEEIADE